MGGCFGMALLDGNLYATDHVAGILRINLDSGVTTSIIDNFTQNYCPHGIAIVQNEIFFSDVLHKKLYRINCDDDFSQISVVVGSGQDGNEDGIGTFCKFSQPTGLCSEGSTLVLVDSGAKNIRIVTSVLPLVKYLSKLGQLYKTFSVHESILGKNPKNDITTCASTLNDILHFLESMRDGAKDLLNLKANALQGPHGVPASKTIYSVSMLREMLLLLADVINRVNHNYIESLNVNSLLTLVNEQLHSILRLRVETPSVLDCARDFMRGVLELLKRLSWCGFHYFTSKNRSTYEEVKKHVFPFDERLVRTKGEMVHTLPKEDVRLLLEFREKFGKGVRQRSVRSDNTKFNAGTLPLVLYKNNIPPPCSPINLNHDDRSDTSTDNIIIIYHVGEVLALTIDDAFCIGKVVESVTDASETCKLLLYKERDQPLEFQCELSPSIVPCAFISERLDISGQDIGAVYIMDDDKFNELNIHKHTEHVSVEEELNDIENVFEAELVVCDTTKTRSGRKIGTPKYLWDYY